jgi:hypothetical protein
MFCWFTSLLFGLCPLQNITKLRLENNRQKFSPTKNSLQNLTYFRNVISNPEEATVRTEMEIGPDAKTNRQKILENFDGE